MNSLPKIALLQIIDYLSQKEVLNLCLSDKKINKYLKSFNLKLDYILKKEYTFLLFKFDIKEIIKVSVLNNYKYIFLELKDKYINYSIFLTVRYGNKDLYEFLIENEDKDDENNLDKYKILGLIERKEDDFLFILNENTTLFHAEEMMKRKKEVLIKTFIKEVCNDYRILEFIKISLKQNYYLLDYLIKSIKKNITISENLALKYIDKEEVPQIFKDFLIKNLPKDKLIFCYLNLWNVEKLKDLIKKNDNYFRKERDGQEFCYIIFKYIIRKKDKEFFDFLFKKNFLSFSYCKNLILNAKFEEEYYFKKILKKATFLSKNPLVFFSSYICYFFDKKFLDKYDIDAEFGLSVSKTEEEFEYFISRGAKNLNKCLSYYCKKKLADFFIKKGATFCEKCFNVLHNL